MTAPENIIVSLTSWHKRINNVPTVLSCMLNQTLKPSKIILNLCTEDFPNMENDLPDDLINIINQNNIELYWYIENYKAWKKHLHVLDVANDNDIIITVDDDINYPNNFIENLYVSYCYYDKKFPITSSNGLFHNLWTFGGGGMLYRKDFWGKDYKKYLTDKVLYNAYEDIIINTIFAINDVLILPQMFDTPNLDDITFNDNDAFSYIGQSNYNKVQEMMANTLVSMEDMIDNHYFEKDCKHEFTPHFWEILKKCVDNNKHYREIYPAAKIAIDAFYERFLRPEIIKIDRVKSRLFLKRYSKEELIGPRNRVIVTISSWTKRIQNVAPVLHSILDNTIKPDLIYLNLACEDFDYTVDYVDAWHTNTPSKYELSRNYLIPDDLSSLLLDKNVPIELNWYTDAKLKSWKKHLQTIKKCSPNDVILCIDDDILYKPTYIETMLKSYNFYGRKYPITCFTNCFCQGGYSFCGYGTLYTPSFFENIDDFLNSNIVHMFPEDNHLLNILNVNKHPLMPVIGKNYLFLNSKFNEGESNFGNLVFDENWWNQYNELFAESEKILESTCQGREEMAAGWTPRCFNFSIANLRRFLNENEHRKNEEIFKDVYNAIEYHLINNPGSGDDLYNLSSKIDNIIL